MKKTETVSFKISKSVKRQLQEFAFERGMSLSEYVYGKVMDSIDDNSMIGQRGNAILSQEDLDNISARIRLEIEAMELPRQFGYESRAK